MRLLANRVELYSLLPSGIVAEIGVYRGDNAECILNTNRPRKLYLIDAWEQQVGTYEKDPTNDYDLASMHDAVVARFAESLNVCVLKMYSLAAVKFFEEESLDWAYIDGNHSLASVRADLVAWWPKVTLGGFLCGHDYMQKDSKPWIQVKEAVDEFCVTNGIKLYALTDEKYGSWAIRRER